MSALVGSPPLLHHRAANQEKGESVATVGGGVGGAARPAHAPPVPDLQLAVHVDPKVIKDAAGPSSRAETAGARRRRIEQERIDRRAADAELVQQVRRTGCEGTLYAQLEVELVRYGRGVLASWVRQGKIFAEAKRLGRAVPSPQWARTTLHEDEYEREDLVAMVIADALPLFRRDALVAGGWRAEAGASITTYFVNLLVRTFPNHYRSWLAQQERWNPRSMAQAAMFDPERLPRNDPAVLVTMRAQVLAELDKLNPRHRRVMAAFVQGQPQADIARAEGITEKAVERVIAHAREALRRLQTRESAWMTN